MKKHIRTILVIGSILALFSVLLFCSKKFLNVSGDEVVSVAEADTPTTYQDLLNDDEIIYSSYLVTASDYDAEKISYEGEPTEYIYEEIETDEAETLAYESTDPNGVTTTEETKSDTEMVTETKQFVVSKDLVEPSDKDKVVDIIGDYAILEFDDGEESKQAYAEYKEQCSDDVFAPELMKAYDTGEADYKGLSWGYDTIHANEFNDALLQKYGSVDKIPTVKVAVIDTGVDYNHEFLSGRVTKYDYDYVDDDSDAMDENKHGTHVAGIITDTTLANVEIYAYRVLDADGYGSTTDIAQAIKQAANDGADVINMSLGGSVSSTSNDLMDAAMDYAISKNVVIVVAAGNEAEDAKYSCPAHYQKAVTVAAMASNGTIAYYSNYGMGVDITAPGSNINSSVPDNQYKSLSGTSMASPFVAGAAASLKAYLNNDNYTYADISTILKENVTDKGTVGFDTTFGYGLLDMQKVLDCINASDWDYEGVTATPTVETSLTDGILMVEMTAEEGATIYYTTDGTMPSVDGSNASTQIYSGKITSEVALRICAIAKTPNKAISEYVSKIGYIVASDADFEITDDGVLVSYSGKESILHIPEEVINIKVVTIGEECFTSSTLTEVYVPDTVTRIGGMAFHYSSNIQSIHLGKNVKEVDTLAFCYLGKLSEITVDEENPYLIVDNGALYSTGYEYLISLAAYRGDTDFYVNADCEQIVKTATLSLNNLTIHVPSGVVSIYSEPNFSGSSGWIRVGYENYAKYIIDENNPFFTSDGDIVYSKDKSILYACYKKTQNESVSIPNSVKTIKEYAFFDCSNVKSVKLDEGLEIIEGSAFDGVDSNEYIIPSSVNYLGSSCFYGFHRNNVPLKLYFIGDCPYMSYVTYHDVVEVYKKTNATGFDTGLDYLKKYNTVNVYDMSDSTSISLSIPEGFETSKVYIDGEGTTTTYDSSTGLYIVDNGSTDVTSVEARKISDDGTVTKCFWTVEHKIICYTATLIPYEITDSGNIVKYLGNDTSVSVPDSIAGINIVSIGDDAFKNSNITNLEIGKNVADISSTAANWNALEISVADGNEYFAVNDNVLYDKSITKLYGYGKHSNGITFEVPSTVTEIGSYAFLDCTKLTSVTLPKNLEKIDNGAFSGTAVDKYSIPQKVNVLGSQSLGNGNSAITVYFDGNCPEVLEDINGTGDVIVCKYSNATGFDTGLDTLKAKCNVTVKNIDSLIINVKIPSGFDTSKLYLDGVAYPTVYDENTGMYKVMADTLTVKTVGAYKYNSKKQVERVHGWEVSREDEKYKATEVKYEVSLDGGLLSYLGSDSTIHIPEEVAGIKVLSIKYDCSGLDEVNEIYVPDTIERIESGTLTSPSIESVYLGKNVKEIGTFVFNPSGCLKNITVSSDNQYLTVENGALYSKDYEYLFSLAAYDGSLKYHIHQGCKKIVKAATWSPDSMTLYVPASVEELFCDTNFEESSTGCWYPYQTYSKLIVDADNPYLVSDSNGIVYSKDKSVIYACYQETKITDLVIPESVTEIKEYAFANCTGLKSVKFASGLKIIGDNSFCGVAINEFTIPESVTYLGWYCFSGLSRGDTTLKLYFDGDCPDDFYPVAYKNNIEIYRYPDAEGFEAGTYLNKKYNTVTIYDRVYGNTSISLSIPEGFETDKLYLDGKECATVYDSSTGLYTVDNGTRSVKSVEAHKTYEDGTVSKCFWNVEFGTDGYVATLIPFEKTDSGKLIKYLGNETVVTVPSDIIEIGSNSFSSCANVTGVTLPEGLEKIDDSAFAGTSIETFKIPKTVTVLGASSLGDGSKAITVYFDGNCPGEVDEINSTGAVTVWKYSNATGFDTGLEYLKTKCNVTVKNIDSKTVIGVNIPENFDTSKLYLDGKEYLTTYDEEAQLYKADADSTEIKVVEAYKYDEAGNVERIHGWYATYDEKYVLKEAEYEISPDGGISKYIGSSQAIHIPEKVLGIDIWKLNSGIGGLSSVRTIYVSDNITRIESEALSSNSIKTIALGKNVKEIGIEALPDTGYLETLTVDKDNQYLTVDNGALYSIDYSCLISLAAYRDDSKEYHIDSRCKKIQRGATFSRDNLTIYVPASVEDMASTPDFEENSDDYVIGCQTYAKFVIDADNGYFKSDDENGIVYSKDGSVLYACYRGSNLTTFTVPDGVKRIDSFAFSYNEKLTSINLPDGLEKIGDGAFFNVNMDSYTVPSSVNYLGLWCFASGNRSTTLKLYFDGDCPESVREINGNGQVEIYRYIWTTGYDTNLEYLKKFSKVTVCTREYSRTIGVTIPEGYDNTKLYLDGVAYDTTYDESTKLYCAYPESEDISSVVIYKYDSNGNISYAREWTAEFSNGKYELTQIPYEVSADGGLAEYFGKETTIYLPEEVAGIKVWKINDVFETEKTVTEIYVTDGITRIEFGGLQIYDLEKIHLGKNVKEIGTIALGYARTLKELTVDSENSYLKVDEYGVLYTADYKYLLSMAGYTSESEYHVSDKCGKIVRGAMCGYTDDPLTVCIPASVDDLRSTPNFEADYDYFSGFLADVKLLIDEDNPYYTSTVEGTVYNHDKTLLISYFFGSDVKDFIVPDTVEVIDVDAFWNAENLKNIKLPDGLKKISDGAFDGAGITSFTIPASVEYIGESVFQAVEGGLASNVTLYFDGNCPTTKYDFVYSGNAEIYKYPWATGFEGLPEALKKWCNVTLHDREDYSTTVSLIIPEGFDTTKLYINGTETIPTYNEETGTFTIDTESWEVNIIEARKAYEDGTVGKCFWNVEYGAKGAKATLIPYEITSEGKMLRYLGSERTLNIPSTINGISVTTIAKGVLTDTNVEDVVIPDSVTGLDDYAFYNAEYLKYVKFGKNVISIGFWAVPWYAIDISVADGSEYLTVNDNVLYDKSFTTLYGFGKHSGVTTFDVPSTVTNIGSLSFYNNTELTSVTLHEGLAKISQYAFAGTSIDTFMIPATVTSLESLSLGDGSRPVTVYFDGDCPNPVGNVNDKGAVTIYKYILAKGFDTNLEYLKQSCDVTICVRPSETVMDLSIPDGYDTSKLYIDGIEYTTVYDENSGTYKTDNGLNTASTISAFKLNAAGSPIGMYVWTAEYSDGAYVITPHPELTDILTYKGFSIRIRGYSGIRYKADISTDTKQQLASEEGYSGFKLKEYGVITIPNKYISKYPLVVGGKNVRGSVDYLKADDGTVTEKLFESANGYDSFTGLLTKIPESGYNTDVAFRAYIVLEKDGKTYTFYQKPVARSIYYLAKKYISRNEYAEGSVEYEYLMEIINSVDNQ